MNLALILTLGIVAPLLSMSVSVLGGFGGSGNWNSVRGLELIIERLDGDWKVVEVRLTVIS